MAFTPAEHLAYAKISSEKLKAVYLDLVSFSHALDGIDTQQMQTGAKFSFRYYIDNNTYPCSFLVNQQSLLFYFRQSGTVRQFIERRLTQAGIVYDTNNSGELTCRVREDTDISIIKELVLHSCQRHAAT